MCMRPRQSGNEDGIVNGLITDFSVSILIYVVIPSLFLLIFLLQLQFASTNSSFFVFCLILFPSTGLTMSVCGTAGERCDEIPRTSAGVAAAEDSTCCWHNSRLDP